MSNSEHQLKQVLGFWDLMAASVGQIIGAGIMSLTGAAIAMTGKSVPIAFIISAFLTIFRAVPYVFINSTIRLNGGAYNRPAAGFQEAWWFLHHHLHTGSAVPGYVCAVRC
jgi:APA family basic amino acid/polyamine antiporter